MRTIITLLLSLFIVATMNGAGALEGDKYIDAYEQVDADNRLTTANDVMKFFYDQSLLDKAIVFDGNTGVDEINQQVWYWAAEYYYSHQAYNQALEYALKALPLCTKDDDRANYLSLISLIYFRQSKYEKAAEYAKQCYQLDEKTGDPDIMSSSLNTLAGIYIGANQPQEAEKYILKGIELAKKANNPARMAVLQGMASEVYHAQGNDAEALKYIDEACRIEQQLGNEYKLMVRLSQKASVLIGLHEYSQAEELLSQTTPYFETIGDKQSYGISCNKMGMTQLCQERDAEAVAYFRLAANVLQEIGDKGNEMHSRKGLYEGLWSSNPDSARIELERFNELKDSLYNIASAESLARYNAEFGTDWLQHENEQQKARTRKIIVFGLVLLILIAMAVWLLMHRRMKIRETALQTIINELQGSERANAPQESQPSEQPSESSEPTGADGELLSRVVAIVKSRMSQESFTIETLASEMCTTRGSLNRRIKAITGVTTQQYVLRIRLEHSRILLKEDNRMPISEIAYKCGFEDATSFSRAFRRTFDISPSQYRNQE